MHVPELLQIINIMEVNFACEIDTNTKIDINEESLRKSVMFFIRRLLKN
jgi:hypothetical protein